MTEQDICASQQESGNAETIQLREREEGVVQGEELGDVTHDYTTNKSEAMEMTLEPSTKCDEDPYMEQVNRLCVCTVLETTKSGCCRAHML